MGEREKENILCKMLIEMFFVHKYLYYVCAFLCLYTAKIHRHVKLCCNNNESFSGA